jgi:hypothetical protein
MVIYLLVRNCTVFMKCELGWLWKEAGAAIFNVLSQHLSGVGLLRTSKALVTTDSNQTDIPIPSRITNHYTTTSQFAVTSFLVTRKEERETEMEGESGKRRRTSTMITAHRKVFFALWLLWR